MEITPTVRQIKLAFDEEMRIIAVLGKYADLVEKINQTFGKKLPTNFRICYFDDEGDLISVINQEDFEQALTQKKETIKLYIGTSSESIRESVRLNNQSSSIKLSGSSFSAISAEDSKEKIPPEAEKKEAELEKSQEPKELSFGDTESFDKLSDKEVEDKPSIPSAVKAKEGILHICSICYTEIRDDIRYLCSLCVSFEACEYCQKSCRHLHPLVKCINRIPGDKMNEYDAEYYDKNHKTERSLGPGQQVDIIWTIKNTGTKDWPLDTSFGNTGGDQIAVEDVWVGPVKSGEFVTVKVILKAPTLPGAYRTFYNLLYNQKIKLGPQTSSIIRVGKDKNSKFTFLKPVLPVEPRSRPVPIFAPLAEPLIKNSLLEYQGKMDIPYHMNKNALALFEMFPKIDPGILLDFLVATDNDLNKAVSLVLSGQRERKQEQI